MPTDKLSTELLSIPEFFSLGWTVFKNNLLTILYLVLPVQAALAMINYFFDDFLWLITIPIDVILPMGIAYIVERETNGKKTGLIDIYRILGPVWITGILAHTLSMLIIFGMTLLLIIPGLVWLVYFQFVLCAVVLRGKKWKGALDYSKSLVAGRWWNVFGFLIVFGLINIPFVFIYVLAKQHLLVAVTSSAIADVIAAYTTVLLVLLFLNLDSINMTEEKPAPDVIPQYIRPELLTK